MFKISKPDNKQTRSTINRELQLQLEYATLMEQYKAGRAEIDALLDASRQVVNLSLVLITLLLSLLAFFESSIESSMPFAFLILPFFLYGLVWMQLRHILLMRRASGYISQSIAPRVRQIIQEISPAGPIDQRGILNWEEEWKSPGKRRGKFFLLPVMGANYGLPLFAAVLFAGMYYFYFSQMTWLSWVLIGLNALALLYSLYLGYVIEFKRFGQEYR
jgi:hypothetical protein